MDDFVLGDKVRDTVSGLTGIAINKTEFLNGCVRWAVQPRIDKDGNHPEAVYFDVQQLEKVDNGVNKATKKEKVSNFPANTGGDRPDYRETRSPTS